MQFDFHSSDLRGSGNIEKGGAGAKETTLNKNINTE